MYGSARGLGAKLPRPTDLMAPSCQLARGVFSRGRAGKFAKIVEVSESLSTGARRAEGDSRDQVNTAQLHQRGDRRLHVRVRQSRSTYRNARRDAATEP
jgi:hypothetical protein